MTHLNSRLIPTADLGNNLTERMYHLMQGYYANVNQETFLNDLNEKDWIILLEVENEIQGFSTQQLSYAELNGQKVRIVFSGDTIIEKQYWGSLALALAWGRFMLDLLAQHPNEPLYWILTTKGYKTFRFLSVFFLDYHPRPGAMTPEFESRLADSFCRRKFPERFDPDSGIVRAINGDQHLLPGVAEITGARLKKEDIAFFHRMNPGHERGDQLVCIARFRPENLQPFIRKRLIMEQ